MTPGATATAGIDDFRERIEGAGVDLAGLGADDGRTVVLGERALEVCRQHAALVVGGDEANTLRPSPSMRTRP